MVTAAALASAKKEEAVDFGVSGLLSSFSLFIGTGTAINLSAKRNIKNLTVIGKIYKLVFL